VMWDRAGWLRHIATISQPMRSCAGP
jgi:hypothetical protein